MNIMDGEYRQVNAVGCCSVRWIVAYMGAWMGFMSYLMHVNMSIAIVCMTQRPTEGVIYHYGNQTRQYNISLDKFVTVPNNQLLNLTMVYPKSAENSTTIHNTSEEIRSYDQTADFDWSKQTRSIILSAYFYGFMIIQIPAGWLAARYGGKIVIGISGGVSCVLTLLIPWFARTNVTLLVAARICLGAFGGMGPPAYSGLVGVWALSTERNRFLAILWFGQLSGAVVGYSSSGVLCEHGFDDGWSSIFYVHGMLGVVFVVFWWALIHKSPQKHPRITKAELSILLPHSVHRSAVRSSEREKKDTLSVPWRRIFTYGPVYAIFVASGCDAWTFQFLLTCLPQYMKEVLDFDIQSNGFYSCLPSLTYMAGLVMAGSLADYVRTKKLVSSTVSRKIFQITGFTGVAVCILIPGYLTAEYRHVVIICLCICTWFEAFGALGGYTSNGIDITPRYSPIILGVSNSLASVSGIIVPIVVAEITKYQTVEEWRIVFYIASGVSIFAAVVYGIFGNSDLAPWAHSNTDQEIVIENPTTNKLIES